MQGAPPPVFGAPPPVFGAPPPVFGAPPLLLSPAAPLALFPVAALEPPVAAPEPPLDAGEPALAAPEPPLDGPEPLPAQATSAAALALLIANNSVCLSLVLDADVQLGMCSGSCSTRRSSVQKNRALLQKHPTTAPAVALNAFRNGRFCCAR